MPNVGSQPPTNFSKQRRLIVTGLTGSLLSHAFETSALSEGLDIPSFEFGRYQFTILHPQRDIPFARLFGLDGATVELPTLKGRPILLNFWATWCAPCRAELPILERLHMRQGPDGLHVLAVCEDRAERSAVVRFVEALGIKHLPVYRDPNGYVASSDRDNKKNAPFALYGMPITYLISASGKVVGYMSGAADWNSESAHSLVDYLRRS